MKIKHAIFAAAGLLMFCAPPGSAAVSDLSAMTLEELLDVPITASSLTGCRPSDSAAVAHVITGETIRARGYATLLDLLEDVPQLEISRMAETGPGNILTVQGLNGNERFQIMVDGVRVTPVTGNLYALGRQFSLANAERVELILGPVSALYGADAFSGVVNIVTRPGGTAAGSGSAAFGSYRTRNYTAVASGGSGGAAFSVTADSYHSDGPFMPGYYGSDFSWYNGQFKSGQMRQFGATVAVPYRPYSAEEDALFVHGRLNLRSFEAGWIRMTESHSSSLGVKPDLSLYVPDAVFETHYDTIYGRHSYRSDDGSLNLDTLLTRHSYEVDPRTKFLNQYSGYQDAYKYARDLSFNLEERLAWRFSDRDILLLGLSYQETSSLPRTEDLAAPFDPDVPADSQGFIYPGSDLSTTTPNGIPQDFYYMEYRNFGSYAQLQLNREGALQATLGARFDNNSLYGNSFNPRAGLVWRPGAKDNLKLLYGEAFLAPSPDKTYQHYGSFYADATTASGLRSAFIQVPNRDLKPEKMRSAQTEWTHRFNAKVWTTLSGYHSWIEDLHQSVTTGAGTFKDIPVSNIGIWTNRGTARVYGGTLRVDGKARLGAYSVGSYAAYSYSGGEIDGEFLPYSAKSSVRAGLDVSRGRWSVSPRLIYQSRSYNKTPDSQGNRQYSDPFTVVNLHARYRLAGSGGASFSAFLDVKNLFDERYCNPARADDAGFGASPQEPIRVSGGVTARF